MVPQDPGFSPTHQMNDSVHYGSRISSRYPSVADTLEEEMRDLTNNGWQSN